ncbi:MAG: hypothetical protein ABW321_12400 [Polyangiales bacterium]
MKHVARVMCVVCGALWLACALSACTRGIGDACETSLNCSASATARQCDRSQYGGYCTLTGCQPGGCPSEAVCVTFWQNTAQGEADRNRLSTNFCMRKCDDRSDCRDDDGYDCLLGDEFGFDGEATVEGNEGQRFCAIRLAVSARTAALSTEPSESLESSETAGAPAPDLSSVP